MGSDSSHMNLRIPGPTPLPPEVREALSQPMISHRGSEYKELHKEVATLAQAFFQTRNDVFLYTSSGTGMMEASIVNTLSPGDKVLGVTIGNFGDRYMSVAKAHGIDVTILSFPQGQAADPNKVVEAYSMITDCKAVLITHNETSTGIENPLRQIVTLIRGASKSSEPLFLVDSVSGMGNVDLPVDELGLDVVFTSSQKAWMAPPGIAMVSISKRAWEANKKATCARYYFDFANMKKFHDQNQTPETPAISNLFGLRAALQLLHKRGVVETFAYYDELSAYTRKKAMAAGFKHFGDEAHASKTVSAFYTPEGLSGEEFRKTLKKNHHIILSGGMGDMKDSIFRIAHMGFVTKKDIDEVIEKVAVVREELQRSV